MKEQDKQLLLAELGGRLPYDVKIRMVHYEMKGADPEYADDTFSTMYYNMIDYDDDSFEFLPYLRPMSSMTDEESTEYLNACGNEMDNPLSSPRYSGIDWLNRYHFDYRGLIEKGLALEAPEDMY